MREILRIHLQCDDNCDNRAAEQECDKMCCSYGEATDCGNRFLQRRIWKRVEPFYTGEHRGMGLRCAEPVIEPGDGVLEMVGEIYSTRDFKVRGIGWNKVFSPLARAVASVLLFPFNCIALGTGAGRFPHDESGIGLSPGFTRPRLGRAISQSQLRAQLRATGT